MSDMAEPPEASGDAVEPRRNSAPARPRNTPFEAALIIAALSAFAYSLAWIHEMIAAGFFGVPAELVEVDTRTIASIGGVASTLLLLGLMLASQLYDSIQRPYHPVRRRIIFSVPVLVMLGLYAITFPMRYWTWSLFPFILIVFLAWDWLVPLLQTNTRGYMQKLRAYDKISEDPTPTLLRRMYQRWPASGLVVLLAVFITMGTMAHAVRQARTKERFFVPSTAPDTVVLRIYGNRLICAPVDRTTKQIARAIQVLRLGDDPKMVLRSERIGPLRLKE